jgi:hypothetical protein
LSVVFPKTGSSAKTSPRIAARTSKRGSTADRAPAAIDVVTWLGVAFLTWYGVASLLRAAARLSPDEFVLTVPKLLPGYDWEVDLPSFHRAASIKLDVVHLLLQLPAETQFPTLETLCECSGLNYLCMGSTTT